MKIAKAGRLAFTCLMTTALLLTGCGEDAAPKAAEHRQSAEVEGHFPNFTAKDLSGKDVTGDIFTRKKITVVNIWGTFCPPCVGEMPDLGKWAKEMPNDAQIIGIVCDIEGNDDEKTKEAAKKILKEADAEFVNIIPGKDLENYMNTVNVVPTTIFVDSLGNIVGDPILGADVGSYKKFVDGYLGK